MILALKRACILCLCSSAFTGCDPPPVLPSSGDTEIEEKARTGKSSNIYSTPPDIILGDVPCSANVRTEVNFGVSAAVYVDVQIAAKNITDHPVDGVTWSMFDHVGNILFTETWVSINQKQHFFINPSLIGVTPIAPGATVKLTGATPFTHMENLIRNLNESTNTELQNTLQVAKTVAEEKYSNVTCKIQGFVKEMFPKGEAG